MFLYLLKVNIALVLFYLAYCYGLRRLTFYTLNRFYLLFAIGFSSVYPLIDLSGLIKRQAAGGEAIYYLPDLGNVAAESPHPVWNVLAFVFWSGVAVMGARFLIQLLSLARLHFASRKQGAGKPVIRTMNEKINPFSFFGSIYLNPVLHSPAERDSIIEHEKVHISEWHTIDVLAGELNRIFYWFNPGAWLIMNAVRENLEFMADRKVLQSGADVKTYQYNLIKVSKNPYVSSLANNFNFAHLKIRVTMMNKKPSSELHLVKYLVLVPFLALISLAFNISDRPAKEAPPRMNDEQLVSPLDTLPADSEVVAWGYFLRGDTSGFFSNPPSKSEGWKKALFIVDRKEWKFADVMKLAPNDILSLSIIKDAQALYGEKGKNGVIIINTKKGADTTSKRSDFLTDSTGKEKLAINGRFKKITLLDTSGMFSLRQVITLEKGKDVQVSYGSSNPAKLRIINGDKALILIDGKESDYKTMQGLTEEDIDARTIVSGKAAAEQYGSKAEYGVIKITTKGPTQ